MIVISAAQHLPPGKHTSQEGLSTRIRKLDKISNMRKCGKCSAENIDTANYCESCGQPLSLTKYEVAPLGTRRKLLNLEREYVISPTIRTGLRTLFKAISHKVGDFLDELIIFILCLCAPVAISVISYAISSKHYNHHIESKSGQYALFRKDEQLTPYIYDTLILKYDKEDAKRLEYVLAKSNGKYGRLNHKGQILNSCKYDYIYNFNNGWAITRIDNLYGYIKEKKSILAKDVDPQFIAAADFRKDFARIRYPDKTYGWINQSGKEVPWGRVRLGGHYSNGLAWVSTDNSGKSFGYVNAKGKVTNLHATNCQEFYKKRAFVSKGSGWAMIDTDFKLVTDYELYPPDKNTGFQHKSHTGWKVIYEGADCYVNKRGKITPISSK